MLTFSTMRHSIPKGEAMIRRITIAPLVASLALLMASLISSADAAEQGTAPVEGERFTKPPGTQVVLGDQYSGGKALKITSGKAVPTKKQVTITETSKVLVRAHAGQKGGSPTLTIRVDGANAGKRRITSSALADYLYSGITLQPGTYTIGLKGGDLAQGRNVFVDVVSFPALVEPPPNTPPETTITNFELYDGSGDGKVNDGAVYFTSDNPNASFRCQFFHDGVPGFSNPCGEPSGTPGELKYPFANLPDGSWEVRVTAFSPSGNPDPTPASHTFTIDTTPPVVDAMGGIDGAGVGSRQADFTANEPATFE
jgi:hypothetical protein